MDKKIRTRRKQIADLTILPRHARARHWLRHVVTVMPPENSVESEFSLDFLSSCAIAQAPPAEIVRSLCR
jgi:hypothetical protein